MREDVQVRLEKIPPLLLVWYREIKRNLPWRENKDPYRIWVSEIMLQQTRVDTAIPYFNRFVKALPSVRELADAPEEKLLKLWEGLGYYSRVRNLQKGARQVVENHGCKVPQEYDALRALAGVGEYTAGAISSIAFDLPVAAVDGNVLRVLSRILLWEEDVLSAQAKKAAKELLEKVIPEEAGDFNQALMELGALICLPGMAAKCEACPLYTLCLAREAGRQGELPRKAEKKPKKVEERTVFLLCSEGKIALRRRPETGLLRGMWELPSVQGTLTPEKVHALLQNWGLTPKDVQPLRDAQHTFSHIQWKMKAWRCDCTLRTADFFWAGEEELRTRVALPSAFKAYREEIEKAICPSRR